ncbi:MAG: PspA/IM30 family protein, partial [Chloroflexi bacterium]|nr:PspA/IM30 family protein [Chloroflexota bacterium]
MLKAIRRWWRYLGTKLGMQLDEIADPKVQLEQAIGEAREQHRLLTEQAANVVANQVQLQTRLDRSIEEYGRVTASARQAVVLADQAERAGDASKAASFTQAAEAFVARQIALERDIESLRRSLLDATGASDRAKQAVRTSSMALQKKLADRESLLSRLDQAEMQEQMNAAMLQLTASVDSDSPTLEEVSDKIDRRLAAAQAMTEISGANVDMQMLEIEEAQRQAETDVRLGELRSQMGILVTPVDRLALSAPSSSELPPAEASPAEASPAEASPAKASLASPTWTATKPFASLNAALDVLDVSDLLGDLE